MDNIPNTDPCEGDHLSGGTSQSRIGIGESSAFHANLRSRGMFHNVFLVSTECARCVFDGNLDCLLPDQQYDAAS